MLSQILYTILSALGIYTQCENGVLEKIKRGRIEFVTSGARKSRIVSGTEEWRDVLNSVLDIVNNRCKEIITDTQAMKAKNCFSEDQISEQLKEHLMKVSSLVASNLGQQFHNIIVNGAIVVDYQTFVMILMSEIIGESVDSETLLQIKIELF